MLKQDVGVQQVKCTILVINAASPAQLVNTKTALSTQVDHVNHVQVERLQVLVQAHVVVGRVNTEAVLHVLAAKLVNTCITVFTQVHHVIHVLEDEFL